MIGYQSSEFKLEELECLVGWDAKVVFILADLSDVGDLQGDGAM